MGRLVVRVRVGVGCAPGLQSRTAHGMSLPWHGMRSSTTMVLHAPSLKRRTWGKGEGTRTVIFRIVYF